MSKPNRPGNGSGIGQRLIFACGCTVASLLFLIPRGAAAAETLSFQAGDGGLHSTTDATFISVGGPDVNHGSWDVLQLGGDGAAPLYKGLTRFPDIFGNQTGQIPPTSAILSATLDVWTTDFLTGDTFGVHRVLVPWSEETVTWNSFGSSPGGAPDLDYVATPTETFFATDPQLTLDITPIVQAWSENVLSNQGVMIVGTAAGLGLELWSDDAPFISSRPKLTIEFDSSTPNRTTSWGRVKATY